MGNCLGERHHGWRQSAPTSETLQVTRRIGFTRNRRITGVPTPSGRTTNLADNDLTRAGYPVNSVFQRQWWLDTVAPGWRPLEVRQDDGALLGWMPLTIGAGRYGRSAIDMPPLTQTLGPCLVDSPGDTKQLKRTSRWMKTMSGLAAQIPKTVLFRQGFHHSLPTVLPFIQQGFKVELRYTHLIPDLSDLDQVWSSFSQPMRSSLRRAEGELEVSVTDDVELLIDLVRMTYERQGMKMPHSPKFIRKLDAACAAHDARRILVASDEAGRVHGCRYMVFDSSAAYDLMSGLNPSLRSSNAGSALMWGAIKEAATVSSSFDFEGGSLATHEPFVRKFGPRQTPYTLVSRESKAFRTTALAIDSVRDTAALIKRAR